MDNRGESTALQGGEDVNECPVPEKAVLNGRVGEIEFGLMAREETP
jgi:hypothetical protein